MIAFRQTLSRAVTSLGNRLLGGTRLTTQPVELHVRFHRDVLEEMDEQIARHPDVEVGGKFVGRVRGRLDMASRDWERQLSQLEVDVIASLDAGPKAVRTATYHLPDGEYQERLFRRLESTDPEVEHLGTWHSHHPNGLDTLSEGDVLGYLESVNDPNYHLDFFIAALAVDHAGFHHARHFLFLRGIRRHYFELTPSSIVVVDSLNPYTPILAEGDAVALSSASKRRESEPSSSVNWYESESGRRELASDRAWIMEILEEPKANRRHGLIIWRGGIEWAGRKGQIEYLYPKDFPFSGPVVSFRSDDPGLSVNLRIELQPREDRKVQFLRLIDRLGFLRDLARHGDGAREMTGDDRNVNPRSG